MTLLVLGLPRLMDFVRRFGSRSRGLGYERRRQGLPLVWYRMALRIREHALQCGVGYRVNAIPSHVSVYLAHQHPQHTLVTINTCLVMILHGRRESELLELLLLVLWGSLVILTRCSSARLRTSQGT